MSNHSASFLKKDLEAFGSELNQLIIQKSKIDLIVTDKSEINNIVNDNLATSKNSQGILFYGATGAAIGFGISKFSGSETTAQVTLTAVGAIIGIGFSIFKSGKSKISQVENIVSINIDYFQSKQNLIVLIRDVNKIVEQQWDDKSGTFKDQLQEKIRNSTLTRDQKNDMLEFTYVYKSMVLEQTTFLLKMNNLLEGSNFSKELEDIKEEWISNSINVISKTIEEQWNSKYSKIIF